MPPSFDITPARGEMKGYTRLKVCDRFSVVAAGTGPQAEADVLTLWQEKMLLARIEIQEGRDG